MSERAPEAKDELQTTPVSLGERLVAYLQGDVPPADDNETARPSPLPREPISEQSGTIEDHE